jgi:hypothetical protein
MSERVQDRDTAQATRSDDDEPSGKAPTSPLDVAYPCRPGGGPGPDRWPCDPANRHRRPARRAEIRGPTVPAPSGRRRGRPTSASSRGCTRTDGGGDHGLALARGMTMLSMFVSGASSSTGCARTHRALGSTSRKARAPALLLSGASTLVAGNAGSWHVAAETSVVPLVKKKRNAKNPVPIYRHSSFNRGLTVTRVGRYHACERSGGRPPRYKVRPKRP